MSIAIVIPAQLNSKRFPNKPKAIILGKPMLSHVVENCLKVIGVKVYVATPDIEIATKIKNTYNVKSILTSQDNTTGNEAVAEAALQIEEDIIVNVQGDEPMIGPELISYVIDKFITVKDNYQILNCYTKVKAGEEFHSPNCIHVAVNKNNELMYMSRRVIPYRKDNLYDSPLKQVCIYVFKRGALIYLYRECKKRYLEQSEDICMLRPLEEGYKVYMLPVETNSHAVDVPEDVAIVESRIRGMA